MCVNTHVCLWAGGEICFKHLRTSPMTQKLPDLLVVMEKLCSVCEHLPPLTPQPHMHNTHLISRGDVLMTHLSSHFIDAGPSVAFKKKRRRSNNWTRPSSGGCSHLFGMGLNKLSRAMTAPRSASVTDICNASVATCYITCSRTTHELQVPCF